MDEESYGSWPKELPTATQEHESLQRRIEQLEKALMRHGRHSADCAAITMAGGVVIYTGDTCTCGLDAARGK